mgnify:CR=1 FL=1
MPLRMNYGGILQNYALQTVFRDLGHSPITFRMDKKEYWGWIISSIKAIVRFRQLPVPPWVFRKRFSGNAVEKLLPGTGTLNCNMK